MSFSDQAWSSVSATYDAIVRHPFVQHLGDGTLEPEVFERYLLDDAVYLATYARVLAIVASRLRVPGDVAELSGAAQGAVVAERSLHEELLRPRGLDPDAAEATPTCLAYTGLLTQHAAFSPVEVALAAVLPCFRVYAEVGAALLAARRPGEHPYASWIETYADPEFTASVQRVEEIADRLAAESPHVDAMHRAYATATTLEWMFWDAAWSGERLPTFSTPG